MYTESSSLLFLPLHSRCNVGLKLPKLNFGNFYVNTVIMSNGYVNMGSLSHAPTPNCSQPHPDFSRTLKMWNWCLSSGPLGALAGPQDPSPCALRGIPWLSKIARTQRPTEASQLPLLGDDELAFLLDKEINCVQKQPSPGIELPPAPSFHGSQLAQAAD